MITIAGPLIRLTEARMLQLGPALKEVAAELALASAASPILARRTPATLADTATAPGPKITLLTRRSAAYSFSGKPYSTRASCVNRQS